MAKKVRLRDVTADNWEEVVDLEVSDEQEDFVADNAYSLAESKFDPYVKPRAIYAGKHVVGFLMYESLESDGKPHDYSIYRLMVDKRHQGRGYGRAALELAIDEIKQDRHVTGSPSPMCRAIRRRSTSMAVSASRRSVSMRTAR
jgi:diamine N-acetyltransferase